MISRLQELIRTKRCLHQFNLSNPKFHILEINSESSLNEMLPLWNRSIAEPKFETVKDFKDNLFSCTKTQDIVCLVCLRKDKFLGFIYGCTAFVNHPLRVVGSVEAIGVDPDIRRRGVATFLLAALKKRFLEKKIQSFYVCEKMLFFPGLHLKDHEAAIGFFIKQGFMRSQYTEEAIFRREFYKEPKGLDRVMNLCQKKGLIFEPLDFQRSDTFLRFIDEQSPTSTSWVRKRLMSLDSDSTKEGFWIARLEDNVIGCIYYANAVCLKDLSTRFREAEWKKSGIFDGSKLYIWDLLRIAKSHRGRGIGGVLMHQAFSQVWKLDPLAAFIFNHNLPKFYTRFGSKEIDRFMSLYCP